MFSGAGAAAIATAEHYVRLGVQRENIILCDRDGVIYNGRDGRHGSVQGAVRRRHDSAHARRRARRRRRVRRAVRRRRGHAARWSRRWRRTRSSSRSPIPVPEILPDEVRAVRDDAIIATGRSDYPNQVNNVLGFPFIFRGALDVRATEINEEMKMAATRALALLAKEDVPDSVSRAVRLRDVQFGREYLIPVPVRSARAALGRAGRRVGRGRERRARTSSSTSTTIASSSRRGSAARAASCAA